MNDKIVEYIRQNEKLYTREVITQQLIKTGYAEVDIEAAFKQLEQEEDKRDFVIIDEPPYAKFELGDEEQDVHRRKNDPPLWWDSALLGFLLFVIVSACILLITLKFASGWILIVGIGILGVGLTLPSPLESDTPRLAQGVRTGFRTVFVISIVLPFCAAVIISGLCVFGFVHI